MLCFARVVSTALVLGLGLAAFASPQAAASASGTASVSGGGGVTASGLARRAHLALKGYELSLADWHAQNKYRQVNSGVKDASRLARSVRASSRKSRQAKAASIRRNIADEARSAEIDERQAVHDGIVKRERKTVTKKRVDHKKRSSVTDVSEGAKSDSMTDAFACGEEGLSCPGSYSGVGFPACIQGFCTLLCPPGLSLATVSEVPYCS